VHVLELKVPPAAVFLFIAALMWLVARAVPAFDLALPGRGLLAATLGGAGAAMIVSAAASFRRAKTTVNPMKPDSSSLLVRSGVYRLTRNPMYLGLLLLLIGWAVFLSNAVSFLVLPLFIYYMNRFQIEPEEEALSRRFGEEFAAYKSRVRRWI
jgi:protein-S-isoprenylcysteine O-methyltransferase Ste14